MSFRNKGVTPIISTLLLIMIVIILISMSYVFLTRTFESVSSTTGGQSEEASKKIGEGFKIDGVDKNLVYVRNQGTSGLSGLKFYVNDSMTAVLDYDTAVIAPDGVGCFAIDSSNMHGNVVIKVTGSVKTAEAQKDYTGVSGFYANCPP